jgi:TatD DNase family protein
LKRLACTDIGANLLHRQFDGDRDEVIRNAQAAGVKRMIITCTDLDESARGIEFCRKAADALWCTAGVHPHDAKDTGPDWLDRLAELADNPEVKALGEMGLDFNRNYSPAERQVEVFEAQLAIAAEHGKPVFVHDRDSRGQVYELLSQYASSLCGVVVHCFTGSREDLKRYLDAGFYIGITGWVCDQRRGQSLREIVTEIPLEQLLVETDAPFLRPHNAPINTDKAHQADNRRRNEPALLTFVIETIADLHQLDAARVAEATHRNASTLFNLPDDL